MAGNAAGQASGADRRAAASADDALLHRRTLAKVSRRLIPFLMAMFCVNFLDRVNISFAALQMNRDLGLTPQVYGFAAGILFVTYTACEIPSNLLLERIGAGRWLARIMVTWGIVAVTTAFVHGRYSLFVARGLLGVAEAGFAPGAMVYLMRWFPEADRGRAITTYLVGSPISLIVGGPLSAALLSMDGFAGLAGWRWLFILEGVPSVMLGVVAFWWLTDKPAEAGWLDARERAWLATRMTAEAAAKRHTSPARLINVFRDPATLVLTAAKFATLVASYGITLWLPQIIKEFGHVSTMQIGLLTSIPWIFAAIASVLVGHRSDRTGERIWHIATPAFIGAVGFIVAGLAGNPVVAMVGISVAVTGLWVSNTVFWTLPTSLLTGMSAAAGLALINSVGNLGGFVGPYLTGLIRGANADYLLAFAMFGFVLALSGALVVVVGRIVAARAARIFVRAA